MRKLTDPLLRHSWWMDLALLALTTGLGAWIMVDNALRFPEEEHYLSSGLAAVAGTLVLLAGGILRTRCTALSLGLTSVALLILAYPSFVGGLKAWFVAPVALVLYSAARAPQTALRTALIALTVLSCAVTVACGYRMGGFPSSRAFLFALVLAALPLALGLAARQRRLAFEGSQARVALLEADAEQTRRLAAQDERARIAREMHDIVAHSLAVIASQAEGGRTALSQAPELSSQAFGTIGDTARTSLAEMRHLLGVLRTDDDAERRSTPGLEDLDALVESTRSAGAVICFTAQGDPRPERLSTGAQLVLYRAAQEMLTNAVKHGSGQPVELTLLWTQETCELLCSNESATDTPGEGLGLVGMRERAALYDGAMETRLADGRFTARIALPVSVRKEPAALDKPAALKDPAAS